MELDIQYRMAGHRDIPILEEAGDKLFDHQIRRDCAHDFFEDQRHHLAIALDAGKVVAFASGFSYIHPDKETMSFINEVAVLEEYQNNGIGRKIVKYLCKYFAGLGIKEAWIATHVPNTPARKAFKAAGGNEDEDLAVVFNYDLTKIE